MIDAVLAALLIGWGAVGWWLFFRERRESQELFDALKMANEGLADYRNNFTKIAWQWPDSEQTETEGEKNEQD